MDVFSGKIEMVQACPILTSEQRKAAEILRDAQQAMLDRINAAVAEAEARVGEQVLAAGLDLPAPSIAYFESVVHQQMFLSLCGTDSGSFEGGDVEKAIAIIRNEQRIANKYWGADIELLPQRIAPRSSPVS